MAETLFDLYRLCEDGERLIPRLRELEMVPQEGAYRCNRCAGFLTLCPDASRSEGCEWRCKNMVSRRKQKPKRCTNIVALREGTFFNNSKLSMYQILGFVDMWVNNCPMTYIQQQLDMGHQTCEDWSSFCREVLVESFILKKEKLGGPGKVVEIGESKFEKCKYQHGHHVEGQWVFGGYERGTGCIFLVPVEDRDSRTLLPIIREWILPGTTIISDFRGEYDCLEDEGYHHEKVSQGLHFKDPVSGIHTNAIKSTWRAAKASMSSSGHHKSHMPGNLAKYMFFKKCKKLNMNRAEEFYRLAGRLYNPCNPNREESLEREEMPEPEPRSPEEDRRRPH